VIFGKASGFAADLKPFRAQWRQRVQAKRTARDHSGDAVSGAGDVNGDGFDDLVIGAVTPTPMASEPGQAT
jgi:hypothetical protein